MEPLARRTFLKKTSAVVAGMSLFPVRPWARVLGANDDVRLAVVGMRGKGRQHIDLFRGMNGVRVVALCDADRDILRRETGRFARRHEAISAYNDIRDLLADDGVDAIVVATPHHWHALATVWACQAGKDVYVEKPASHSVWEGRRMIEAARKYNRIVQHGTQKRSDQGLREAVEWVRAGNLGKILLARGLCYKRRGSIGKVSVPQRPPRGVDYDLWTGPSPMRPLMRRSLHYDWHWIWDTGNGDLGNQGVHEMDICRWFAGANAPAPRVISVAGRFGYEDDGETPNTQFLYHDYEDVPIVFEVRGLPMKPGMRAMPHYRGVRIGNVIHCEGGHFAGGAAYDEKGKKVKSFKRDGGGGHGRNFIQAVRSRKTSDLHADVFEGHMSALLCHTGSISHRLGEERPPRRIQEALGENPWAVETFERMQAHLAVHDIDLSGTRAVLGPWLRMDPDREVFVGEWAEQANQLLKDEYRAPFILPEKV